VVCYADSTITLPIITAYALTRVKPRPRKELYHRRDALLDSLKAQYFKHGKVEKIEHRTDITKPKRGRSGRSVTGTSRKNA
jgi:deoxyhypusine synthase